MSVSRAVLVACAAIALAAPAAALAHQGNPNFRSDVRAVTPPATACRVEVLNRDDRLAAAQPQRPQRSSSTATTGEPYARMLRRRHGRRSTATRRPTTSTRTATAA